MTQLSAAEVARLAIDAGFSGGAATTAVAIAMAESGGDTSARGDTTITNAKWGPSIGLWQIRSLNAERGSGGQRDEIANLNPATNARHAFAISNGGTSWRAWSTYTSGAYLVQLPAAQRATGSPAGSVNFASNTSSYNPLTALMDGGLWARLGLFVLGGVLLMFALYRITGIGDAVVSLAKARVGLK